MYFEGWAWHSKTEVKAMTTFVSRLGCLRCRLGVPDIVDGDTVEAIRMPNLACEGGARLRGIEQERRE